MNLKKTKTSTLVICFLLLTLHTLVAQTAKTYSLSELFELAIANNKQLKLSQIDEETAQLATKLAKTALLPNVDISFSALYIGNGVIMDRDFTKIQNIEMPHFGNNFGIEASQVIFAGGAITTNIEKARLEDQVAQLNYERDELDICFLITAYYLDIYKLRNQKRVFLNNIELTVALIQEIKSKETQGMALGSDVIRHELMLQNLKLELMEVENSNRIINNQMVIMLGLSADIQIIPDSKILETDISITNQDKLLQQAVKNLPELRSAALNK